MAPEILRSIDVEEFVRRLRETVKADKRFALFLGAGCSVSSGIPSAGDLVKNHWLPRLRDIRAPERSDLEVWATEVIPNYDPASPAASYGTLIDKLFLHAEERQREIEDLCDGQTPAFGYAVLAQLVARIEGSFNIVLTTNFDDLIADALYLYTEARPLVIHHESLAAFIRPTRTRPLVVKLHGDHRLAPLNTSLETESLAEEIQKHIKMALHDRGIVFIGYGGADRGILKMLHDLPKEALPFGAYWVHPEEPRGAIREWLIIRKGIWVKSGWFDEVMLLARNEFALPHPNEERFTRIFDDYQEKFQVLSSAILKKPSQEAGVKALKRAATEATESFPGYWRVIAEAYRLHANPVQADAVYQQGIKNFPGAVPLLSNYALFLSDILKNYDAAEIFYKRALDADPKNATVLGNYAHFLDDVRKDYDAAENLYKLALDGDPKGANKLRNYAIFLDDIRKNYDVAETMYKRAMDADPKDATHLTDYAIFLKKARKDYDTAEIFYKRALDADPQNTIHLFNYATFLNDIRKDYNGAEALYKQAIDADPKNASALADYAIFLVNIRKDYDRAEDFFKGALKVNPKDAKHLSNYAVFLNDIRKDHDAADAMYKRAIDADPKHAERLVNYATFQKDIRKNYDAAEIFYKRAVDAKPEDANYLVRFAIFLKNIRKDYDAAETFYKRALDAAPKSSDVLSSYAIFLQTIRKDHNSAEIMYRRALDSNPIDTNTRANLAGLLVARGDLQGMRILEELIDPDRKEIPPALEAECAFYVFAQGSPVQRLNALSTLKRLISSGVHSPDWDFFFNIERARTDGHPDAAWLPKLAAVINDESGPETLDDWPAWRNAG